MDPRGGSEVADMAIEAGPLSLADDIELATTSIPHSAKVDDPFLITFESPFDADNPR